MTDFEKDTIRRQITAMLTPAKNRSFYICPFCGSGTGPNATGAVKLNPDGVHAHCHACDKHFDVMDILVLQL